MNSLHQDEIIKLENNDLQLQYILGGLYPHGGMNCNYWGCDIRCSTQPVEDDEKLKKVKDFIKKHNISNSTFLRLARTYLSGSFNSYKGDFGNLIPELDRAILKYEFKHTNDNSFVENDLKERELIELIEIHGNVEGTTLNDFLKKYSLTQVDFMILAKTSINYKYKEGRWFERTDLPEELIEILRTYDLYQSYEFVEEYRKSLETTNSKALNEEQPKLLVKRLKSRFKKINIHR